MRPLALSLYGLASGLIEPLAPVVLRSRAARGKEDPTRVGERMGYAGKPRPAGPLVWLHGVSVGEAMSLLPLTQALARPGLTLLVTSSTRTSANLLAKRLPEGVIHQYAPVDAPGAVRRFLDTWRPDAAIQVESELWPNMIMESKAKGVRQALVSARMTQSSADGWARAPRSARWLLSSFELVLPQDDETEARLRGLGATTGPHLNLKTVGDPLPADPAELDRLQAAIGGRKSVLAASTHPGEDELIARAVQAAGALLIVAPRHPERGPALAEQLAASGHTVARRSAGEPLTAQTTAYVADTLGEMGLFFRACDVTVMGGSFLPGIGGHNPMEPARLGAQILTGPHVFNAASIYAEMFAQAAAVACADEAALTRDLKGILTEPLVGERIGRAALAYAQRQGAAFDEALALLRPLMPA